MRTYVYLLIALLSWACDDNSVDGVFDDSPEHRVTTQIDSMRNCLVSADYGWVAAIRYNNDQYMDFFHIRFKDDYRAVITFGQGSKALVREANYTLFYTQQVDLVFDSHSLLDTLVNMGGDFRFELRETGEGTLRWGARNTDLSNGGGSMMLEAAKSEDMYAQVLNMRERVVNNANKSFYRILTLDGSETKYSFYYLMSAIFEWPGTDNTIQSEEIVADIDEQGFELTRPFEVEGKQITHFVYNASDDTFDACDEHGKIGTLAYTDTKPFRRPGTIKTFMATQGAETNTLMILPIGHSQMYSDSLQVLVDQVGDDFQWVQLQPGNSQAVYIFKEYSRTCYYRIETVYDDDEITIKWTGTAPGISKLMLDYVRPSMHMYEGKFSVVERAGIFYFVRDATPQASYMARAGVLQY